MRTRLHFQWPAASVDVQVQTLLAAGWKVTETAANATNRWGYADCLP